MIEAFLNNLLSTFLEISPYLLFGFVVAGLLRWFIPESFILKRLGKASFGSNLWAALFGVPLPLCSCSVVPTALSLRQRGASRGSTVAFLTSTPQTGIDSITVVGSFLGLPLALYMAVITFLSGLMGGRLVDTFDPPTAQEKNFDDRPLEAPLRGFKGFLRYTFIEMTLSLRKWIVIGVVVAAVINVFIPADIVYKLGIADHPWIAYIALLAIGIPMYVCSTGSVPIAAALVAKGFPVGSAIVFLLAGPATNSASLVLLWKALGRRTTLLFVANLAFCSLLFGVIFDYVFAPLFPTPVIEHALHSHDGASDLPAWLTYGSTIAFAALMLYTFVETHLLPLLPRKGGGREVHWQVDKLHCNKCVSRVTQALKELPGVQSVALDVAGTCRIGVESGFEPSRAQKRIEELGYGVRDHVSSGPHKKTH